MSTVESDATARAQAQAERIKREADLFKDEKNGYELRPSLEPKDCAGEPMVEYGAYARMYQARNHYRSSTSTLHYFVRELIEADLSTPEARLSLIQKAYRLTKDGFK